MKYIAAEWPAPPTIRAFTTTRLGFSDSNPKLKEETKKLRDLLSLPADPIWINQIHTTQVVKAIPEHLNADADASYSNEPNCVCAVLTADCLPILICNKQGSHVAAIHAGWRGLAAGIIERTLSSLDLPSKELLVWLGPAISSSQFEVGKDVFDAFTSNNPEAKIAFEPKTNEKWLANLYELARMQLRNFGISHIYGGNFCTYTQNDLFFSFRRDKARMGSLVSVIWIDNKS